MPILLIAIILSIIEGLTEFLPISSTGHLIIAGHLLGFTGEFAKTFEVFIQLGAISAVASVYWQQLRDTKLWPSLIVTSIPALILGFLLRDYIKEVLFNPLSVAIALGVGGVVIILVEKIGHRQEITSLGKINLKQSLKIGLFQTVALIPGVSRAGATIVGGLLTGLDRPTATAYSFLAAVPVMIMATSYDLFKNRELIHGQSVIVLAVGFIGAYLSALVAVKWLIKYVSNHDFKIFGYYRIILAILVGLFLR